MVNTPFDTTTGFEGFISWLANATDGWFFILFLGVIFLIAIIPMIRSWDFDSALLAASFGVMLLAIPLYWAGGLSEESLFFFVILFVLSIVKATIFKD